MPTERNNLEKSNLCANLCCGVFNPKVPDHLEIESYFTAPFCYDRKERSQNMTAWYYYTCVLVIFVLRMECNLIDPEYYE